MKRFSKIMIYLGVFLPLLFLSACGGGGDGDSAGSGKSTDDSSAAAVTTLSGTVADGYLQKARVFLDRNRNRVYDNGEPQVQSGAAGRYSLEVNPGDGELYPVVVDVISGQTIDEDNGSPVTSDYQLESLPGHWKFVSPLTTLISLELAKNPTWTPQQAEISIRSKFGIDAAVSLFHDYISPADVSGDQIVEFERTHRAAQVVAALMGQLRHSLIQNVGQISATEQNLVAYLVSDQVLEQAGGVEQALTDERNGGPVVDIATLIAVISTQINSDDLDGELLDRYEQRLEQNLQTWDMQPPQIQDQLPPENDTASIDAVISITFDEALDETLLTETILDLTGPNGSVTGSLDYDPEHFQLTFTPAQMLLPNSTYQVTVRAELADTLGNPLGHDLSWAFVTIFDQLPPALPDF